MCVLWVYMHVYDRRGVIGKGEGGKRYTVEEHGAFSLYHERNNVVVFELAAIRAKMCRQTDNCIEKFDHVRCLRSLLVLCV